MGSTSTTDPIEERDALQGVLDRVGDVAGFVADVARLLARVARDPRVPVASKALVLAAAAYVVSPVDVLPDALPVVGRLDDLWLLSRSLRRLARSAGYELIEEHWAGSEEGLAAVLFLAGVSR